MVRLKQNLMAAVRGSWLYVLVLATMVFLVLPTLIVIPMSFSDARYLSFPPKSFSIEPFFKYFASLEWRSATQVSLITASLVMVLATTLGTAAA